MQFASQYYLLKILCLFRIRNFWNIQLKIYKITIIWRNKSKHIYKILPKVWYYPFPLRINDLIHFHRTYLEKDQVFLPLHTKCFGIAFHVTKIMNITTHDEYNLPRHGLRSARTEIYTVKCKCLVNFTFRNVKWKEPF